ncbi:MAG TPA: hypothetical protein VLE73_06400 [Candidatus Saccharimonadales bacterium]|nr:hypothetical protein [Candidatus Saccharimonadales bacterium]
MNKDFFAQLDRAVTAASHNEKELLAYPGVVSVGAGPERASGKLTGKAAIVVTVRSKKADKELGGDKPLPTQLNGIPVDVVELGKSVEAPEIVAAQQKAKKVLDSIKDEWLRKPGVTGLGIGYKTTGGQMNVNQIVLKIYVNQKLSDAEVKARKLTAVPAKIDGVVTDVEQLGTLRPAASASGSRDDRKDPLVGGLTVGVNTKPFWFGTLGSIVFDRGTGQQLVLSNQHVLDGPVGTEVVQPSPIGLDDSLEIGFQLDICNPLHFIRLDTPNTTVGTVLAGAAVAALTAAALSDEIDPTRRGQEATVPPAGAKTVAEAHKVTFDYPELPTPGTHFKVKTDWHYTRHTDAGNLSHSASEVKTNPHVLVDKLLLTDKKLYRPGETIKLYGLILPEACAPKSGDKPQPVTLHDIPSLTHMTNFTPPSLTAGASNHPYTVYTNDKPHVTGTVHTDKNEKLQTTAASILNACRCDRYHATAILTPTTVDKAFPVVLRQPVAAAKASVYTDILQIVKKLENKELEQRVYTLLRYGCLYTGELTVGDIPMGPWKHYFFVQTVNNAPAGMDPLEAAKIIGGLPVSQNTRPTLDVACGPFVWEDGQFDIELI